MAIRPRLLLLDDDIDILTEMKAFLDANFDVICVDNLEMAKNAIGNSSVKDKFSVLVTDMRLKEGVEGGLKLARELTASKAHPETIVLTAFPDIENASKSMQANAFGYVEKGQPYTYERLEDLCLKAHIQWCRKNNRIPVEILSNKIAILFGEYQVLTQKSQFLHSGKVDEELPISAQRESLNEVVEYYIHQNNGFLSKFSNGGFLALFKSPTKALETSLVLAKSPSSYMPLTISVLRLAVHWGSVERLALASYDHIFGSDILRCIHLAQSTEYGKIALSKQFNDKLSEFKQFNTKSKTTFSDSGDVILELL